MTGYPFEVKIGYYSLFFRLKLLFRSLNLGSKPWALAENAAIRD